MLLSDILEEKNVFLFPGIGVKPFGREQEFFSKYSKVMSPFLEGGSELAGVNLARELLAERIFENEQFSREVFAYSFSCGVFQVFREKGFVPSIVAGHSLGVYGALYGAEVISFEDGLQMIKSAHDLGRNHCGLNKFGVGVIIGLSCDEVETFLAGEEVVNVHLANLNSESSGVYVGPKDEVETLLKWAEEEGAVKTIRLRIDIPFHSGRFMEPVSAAFKDFLLTLKWHEPQCKILSAIDHRFLSTRGELIDNTAENLSRTVFWPGVLQKLEELGITKVIECGAGISLTQHSRFVEGAPKHYNLKNLRRRLDY